MSLNFIDLPNPERLEIFSQVGKVVHENMKPSEAHQALLATLRRAYGPDLAAYVEISIAGLPPDEFRVTRLWHGDGSEAVPNNSPWRTEGVPIRRGGVIAEIIRQKRPCVARNVTIPEGDPVFPELGQMHCIGAAPGASGEPFNWALVCHPNPEMFSADWLENLVVRIGFISAVMSNMKVFRDLRRANEYIDGEMDRIAAIQRSLLPSTVPNPPGLDVAASSETFDRAGGDLYDYVELDRDRWGFLIADASGHGPSAAVVAAMLNSILHAFPDRSGEPGLARPGELLSFANQQLALKRINNSFVTAFVAVWDPSDRTLVYARAGHNPPMLHRATGEIIELNAVGGIPLGMFGDTRYDSYAEMLNKGDVVLFYTDGIIDAVNERNEPFGEDRLRQVLEQSEDSAGNILSQINAAVADFVGRARRRDDQTVMVLRGK